MRESEGRRWAAMTAVAGTVFIAAGAFWLSFTSLADLAARSGIGAGQAWAWPLIVDGIIVVATVAVVALAGQRSAWYPWALLIGGALVSVTANAIHAVVAADADVPRMLAASVAAVPPVVLLAITPPDRDPHPHHRPPCGTCHCLIPDGHGGVHRRAAARRGATGPSRRHRGGSACSGLGAAQGGLVEQAHRPRTRRPSLHRGPLVRRRAPH